MLNGTAWAKEKVIKFYDWSGPWSVDQITELDLDSESSIIIFYLLLFQNCKVAQKRQHFYFLSGLSIVDFL